MCRCRSEDSASAAPTPLGRGKSSAVPIPLGRGKSSTAPTPLTIPPAVDVDDKRVQDKTWVIEVTDSTEEVCPYPGFEDWSRPCAPHPV